MNQNNEPIFHNVLSTEGFLLYSRKSEINYSLLRYYIKSIFFFVRVCRRYPFQRSRLHLAIARSAI